MFDKGWVFPTRISILAPSRERLLLWLTVFSISSISILAPSRERPLLLEDWHETDKFQSSLPRGSDRSKNL